MYPCPYNENLQVHNRFHFDKQISSNLSLVETKKSTKELRIPKGMKMMLQVAQKMIKKTK